MTRTTAAVATAASIIESDPSLTARLLGETDQWVEIHVSSGAASEARLRDALRAANYGISYSYSGTSLLAWFPLTDEDIA